MSLTMSRAEREEFLAGVHVGVLSVASGDDRGPLTIVRCHFDGYNHHY